MKICYNFKVVIKIKNFKKIVLIILGLGFILLLSAFAYIGFVINKEIKDRCIFSQSKYSGDCVTALSSFLDDQNNNFGDRNSAIWALGQIGDKKALPVLEKYYTGNIPNREPWNGVVSQYELKKAINSVNGHSPNIFRFLLIGNIGK